ncbi:DJA6 [Symbiodinium natans]|uniref:DJA6 protein n=1 Tax=Symbiodinium natans TaxID=878477 RepID=A0A812KUL5_9DINO|nr:DJA6 [Symbiodinium natans]
MVCYYAVLRIPSAASESEIRSAYRRQALSTHPDKGGRAEDFLQVVAAFEILSDPKRRREHDQQLEQPGNLKVQSKRSRPAGRTVPEKGTQEAPKQRKEEKAPDKEPPAGDDPDTTMPQAPSAQAACGLLRELLLLSQKDLLLRLKQMSEEELGHLVEMIDQEVTESATELSVARPACQQEADEDLISEAESTGDADGHTLLPPALADDDMHGRGEETSETPTRTQRRPDEKGEEGDVAVPGARKKRVLLRGVQQARRPREALRGPRYHACIGCRNLVLKSQEVASLDDAIDLHISLVRIRQQILSKLDSGTPGCQALKEAVEAVVQERKDAAAFPLRLAFRVLFGHNNTSKTMRSACQIGPVWEELMQHREMQKRKREDQARARQLKMDKRRQEIQRRRTARLARRKETATRKRQRA